MAEPAKAFRIGDRTFDLTSRTHLMGILNVTPDSFSDGGRYLASDHALRHAETMITEGADILDVGGESSRPAGPYGEGAAQVDVDEETRRTVPVITAIQERFDVPISIDTVKPEVARRALEAGADAVNDIEGFRNPDMLDVASSSRASIFTMHMKGTPRTMQRAPAYDDLVREVSNFLKVSAQRALEAGIPKDKIAIDPGLGFGKSYRDNYVLIRHLSAFTRLGHPVLIGPSRKTFVGFDSALPPQDRLEGSLAAAALCSSGGAQIIRAHDIQATRRAVFVADELRRSDVAAKNATS